MRNYTEPSARNLLRRPLVLGVPLFGLVLVAAGTLAISVVFGGYRFGNIAALSFGVTCYAALRTLSRFAKPGWEEAAIFALERMRSPKVADGRLSVGTCPIELVSPDTLDECDLLSLKDGLLESVIRMKPSQRLTLVCDLSDAGAVMRDVKVEGAFRFKGKIDLPSITGGLIESGCNVYSLYQLPVSTDPLWFFGLLAKLPGELKVIVSVQGVDPREIKRRIEVARRSNALGDASISDVDSDVSFEEATSVLQGISRGDDSVVELSVVILSKQPLELDEALFCREKWPELPVLSVLGIRRRYHRSHFVRAVTAADLIPNVLDPKEEGAAILTTLREKPLYFSPQDPRLEALHWLVVGASGSGKSFFTGLVLNRMIEGGCPMSVVFIDHNRSFRRLVKSGVSPYLEPADIGALECGISQLSDSWNKPGTLSGIELSDLAVQEKKAAIHSVLTKIESFLRSRDTTHTLYVVLDECWNFMRDEPLLVQRAFREFRKLNGAVVAITQSLHDFLTDESGQSICQNAPVRILLRQGEDLARYQGILGLNTVELARVRRLRQKKGEYSECLVKTPFLSRFGRLYPTDLEHGLLRTDNIRAELIEEAKKSREPACVGR